MFKMFQQTKPQHATSKGLRKFGINKIEFGFKYHFCF